MNNLASVQRAALFPAASALRIVVREVPDGPSWDAGVPALIARLMRARGLRTAQDMDLRLQGLRDGSDLADLQHAASRIGAAIVNRERILVVGDFDADGATGTALAVRGLRLLGATEVDFALPDRIRHGYGLSLTLVEELCQRQPQVLITVDQGTASIAGIERANRVGIDVVVTDHHLPGEQLPPAYALVNPNAHGLAHPLASLAGVGVMFHVLAAVRSELQARGALTTSVSLAELLDLVALGTVADLVPLDRHNRILVAEGLRRIRAGRACVGIKALIESAGRDPARLRASDLGFQIAPRLNAAGRLDDMAIGVRCLLSADPGEAAELAARLSELNRERRELQADMEADAQRIVELLLAERSGSVPAGLVVADPAWHPGVVGLVASRLAERLHRPTLALAPVAGEAGEWRGSGRSIAGFHLRDALVEVDRQAPGLMARYGGHAMAAGLTINGGAVDRLVGLFDGVVERLLDPLARTREICTDGALVGEELTLAMALAIEQAGPYGQAFPEPLFDNEFRVLHSRVLKQRHLKLRLERPGKGGLPLEAIWFAAPEEYVRHCPGHLRLLYQLAVERWQGLESLVLQVRHGWASGP